MNANFKISPDLHKYITEKIQQCDHIGETLSDAAKRVSNGYRQALQDILQVSEVSRKEETKNDN